MAKYKVEIEIDVDFEKIFSEIPEGLFKGDAGTNEGYELESISKVLNDCYLNALHKKMDAMVKDEHYKYLEHHLKVDEEIGDCIANKHTITKIG